MGIGFERGTISVMVGAREHWIWKRRFNLIIHDWGHQALSGGSVNGWLKSSGLLSYRRAFSFFIFFFPLSLFFLFSLKEIKVGEDGSDSFVLCFY